MRRWCGLFLLSGLTLPGSAAEPPAEPGAIAPEWRLPAPDPAPGPAVLVKRFGFEKDLEGWEGAKDISIAHAPGALRVTGCSNEHNIFASAPPFPLEKGKAYRLRAKVRVESLPADTRRVQFRVALTLKTSRRCDFQTPEADLGRTGAWQDLKVEFRAPDDAEQATVYLDKGTSQRSAVDVAVGEVLLERIPQTAYETWVGGARLPAAAERLKNIHPRLFFNKTQLSMLRPGPQDPLALILNRVIGQADRYCKEGPPNYQKEDEKKGDDKFQRWQRDAGDGMAVLALAHLLTGEKKYSDKAREFIRTSCAYPTWGKEHNNGVSFVAVSQLTGLALAYDWLYDRLSEGERKQVRETMKVRAGRLARGFGEGQEWLSRNPLAPLRPHLAAACVLCGLAIWEQEKEAASWVYCGHQALLETLAALPADGTHPGGLSGGTYGMVSTFSGWETCADALLRWADVCKSNLELDLFKHPWFRESALFSIHNALPGSFKNERPYVPILCESSRYHVCGPDYQLRKLAREYAGESAPWSERAQWLAARLMPAPSNEGQGLPLLNLVWNGSLVMERAPAVSPALPTLYRFTDLDWVAARSDWTPEASFLAVRAGPPFGHANFFRRRDYQGVNPAPDCGAPHFYAYGDYLLSQRSVREARSSADYNLPRVNGAGQWGEGSRYSSSCAWLTAPHAPRVLEALSGPRADTIVMDLAPAYPASSKLKKFRRTLLFVKPDFLVALDEIAGEEPVEVDWHWHTEGVLTQEAPRASSAPAAETAYYSASATLAALDLAVLLPAGVRSMTELDPALDPQAAAKGEAHCLKAVTREKSATVIGLTVFRARPLKPWDFPQPWDVRLDERKLTIRTERQSFQVRLVLDAAIPLLQD